MSFRTGDRARAHKVSRKRRVHRTLIRLLRRVSAPAQDFARLPEDAREQVATLPVTQSS